MIAQYTDSNAAEEIGQKIDSTAINANSKNVNTKKTYVIRIRKTADLKIIGKVSELQFDTFKSMILKKLYMLTIAKFKYLIQHLIWLAAKQK